MNKVSAVAGTHVGVVRTENQDCLFIAGWSSQVTGVRLEKDLHLGAVTAVIDGMGGHPGGALASRTAAHALGGVGLHQVISVELVNRSLQRVSDMVRETGALTEGLATMGATIAGFVVAPAGLMLFNVGDCSIFRIRDGYAGQLALIDRIDGVTGGSTLAQCLAGTTHPTAIDAHAELFVPDGNERIVLCSDGLTDCVPSAEIARIASSGVGADVVSALIAAAVRAGAPDNVSVVVADYQSSTADEV